MTNSDGGFQFDFQQPEEPGNPPKAPASGQAPTPNPAAPTAGQAPVSPVPTAAAPGQQQYVWDQATQTFRPVEQAPQTTGGETATQAIATPDNASTQLLQPDQPADTPSAPAPGDAATQVFQTMPATVEQQPAQPAVMPPTIPPADPFNDALAGDGPSADAPNHAGNQPKRNIGKIVGIVIAVIAAIALIAGGVFLWSKSNGAVGKAAAQAECQVATKRLDAAGKKLTEAVSQGEAAAQTPSDQVADANTLNALNSALQDADSMQDTPKCDASNASELKQQTKDINDRIDDANSQADAINNAVKAVNDSKSAASTNSLKSNLTSAIQQAQTTLNNSAGAVADENTRTALQTAITNANNIAGSSNPSEADINNAISAMEKAESDVNASIQAKQQADAEAKANNTAGNNVMNGNGNSNSGASTTDPNDVGNRAGGTTDDPNNIGNRAGGAN